MVTIVARAFGVADPLASNDEVLITVDADELLEFYELVPQGFDFT